MQRENRYLVTKWSDIEKYLTESEREQLTKLMQRISYGRVEDGKTTTSSYVVVAHDWPMYETVWKLIENWVDGTLPASASDVVKTVTNCPTCGAECAIGGERTTHYYVPQSKGSLPASRVLDADALVALLADNMVDPVGEPYAKGYFAALTLVLNAVNSGRLDAARVDGEDNFREKLITYTHVISPTLGTGDWHKGFCAAAKQIREEVESGRMDATVTYEALEGELGGGDG